MRQSFISKYILLLFILLIFGCKSETQDYIENISFFKSKEAIDDKGDIKTLPFLNLETNSLGFNDSTYWFKIQLKKKDLNEKLTLQLKEAYLKELNVYNSQLKKTNTFKDSEDAKFYIDIEQQETIFYLKIKFDRNPYLIINIFNDNDLAQVKKREAFKINAYYIFVILVLIVNLILSYLFKDSIFIWYILFVSSVNILVALYDNTLTGFITNPKVLNSIIGIIYLIVPLSTTIFCVKLLKVNTFYPKLIYFLKLLCIPLIILNILFHSTHNFEILAYQDFYSSIFYIITLVLGFLLIKKISYAKYYVIGYSILITAGILYSIVINFGLTYIPVSMDILKLGIIAEIIMLTFATILKAKEVVLENEKNKLALISQSEKIEALKRKKIQQKNFSNEQLISFEKIYNFTKRELDVFDLMRQGLNNQQIANALYISVNTVKFHSRNIYEKMNVKNRGDFIAKVLLDK